MDGQKVSSGCKEAGSLESPEIASTMLWMDAEKQKH
jgi:hypothetical protein